MLELAVVATFERAAVAGSALLYSGTLLATLAVEGTIAAASAARGSRTHAALALVFLNLVSHPIATLLVGDGILGWPAAELSVLLFETLALRSLLEVPLRRTFVVVFLANAASAALALALAL